MSRQLAAISHPLYRLHPHPQLGEEGVPGSCGERGNGQTVGGHLPGSAHHRRRQVRGQVAPAYRDPGPSGGEAEPAELQVISQKGLNPKSYGFKGLSPFYMQKIKCLAIKKLNNGLDKI